MSVVGVRHRSRFGRALAEMHYRLRTEADSPWRRAMAIWLGTLVGTVPVYGVQLFICVALARVFGLSRITTYLAAHVKNPLTAPLLLYLSLGIGNVLFDAPWPHFSLELFRSMSLWSLGRNLFVGSFVLGVVLGAVLAVVSLAVSARSRHSTPHTLLYEEASRRYVEQGIFHWEFVRGKLRGDPLYRGLLEAGVLPRSGSLVDLGCGRGIVPSLIRTARSLYEKGEWDPAWPPPPDELALTGVERRERLARVARSAIGGDVRIETADLTEYTPESCDAILLLDVLHYLERDAQLGVLERACGALRPGGILILREADAALGLRFQLTRLGERISAIARREPSQRFAYRTIDEWRALLAEHGLETRISPMWAGTPFGNVLVVARRPHSKRISSTKTSPGTNACA